MTHTTADTHSARHRSNRISPVWGVVLGMVCLGLLSFLGWNVWTRSVQAVRHVDLPAAPRLADLPIPTTPRLPQPPIPTPR